MKPTPILIIGGGISGLACAWFLRQRGIVIRILESRHQVGGTILTSHLHGYRIEHGPNSTLQKPDHRDDALGRLIHGVHLETDLQIANSMAAKRFVLHGGVPKALPASPFDFFRTDIFSTKAKFRLMAEPFIGRAATEESIATFVRRRLGPEFLNYAIEPFISGVYAGDPERLSVRAAVAKIYALEKKYGSLMFGAMAQGRINKGAGLPKGRMISFGGGMQALPLAIAKTLPRAIQTDAEVTQLEPLASGWQVTWKNSSGKETREQAQQVVLAVPAMVAANLVKHFTPVAGNILKTISYAPIVTVALGYRRKQVQHPLDGFGFLIPRREKVRLLGGLFSSTLFPGRAEEGQVLITAFIGGAMDEKILSMHDQRLVARVERDLSDCLGIKGRAGFVHLTRYNSAIPQYTLGHLQRINDIDVEINKFNGLNFRANWRDGISVADCVRNGEILAERISSSGTI